MGPTVAETLQQAVTRLGQGLDKSSPRLDAEVLLAHVQNWTRTELHCRITDPLPKSRYREFLRLLDERAQGVPIAYLVGYKEFFSRRFWVKPGVLVPRPETELLVEQALTELRKTPGPTRILDLCCGSGCIAITLCLETLGTTAVATDVSPDALAQSRENVCFFAVEERVEVVESDLFSALSKEAFDLIVSNPPYIGTEYGPRPDANVAGHEPALALYSGADGTEYLREIVERAPAHLIEGGSLVVECACFQAERVEAWMADRGFNQTCLWHDLSGLPRGVSGRWEG
ncbi:MAG: peptide chain release factor N(5)-glutamine methyltransferase [Vulcanimicrobiota bacterium]